ncbi:MAG: hypothetical protein WDO70_10970 [Alphaproteobacteria bacterium]
MLDEKDPQRFITFVNPFAWAVAKKEPQYLSALKQMSVVLPDGESVASFAGLSAATIHASASVSICLRSPGRFLKRWPATIISLC